MRTRGFAAHARRFKYVYLAGSILMGSVLLYVSQLPHETLARTGYPNVSDLFDAMNHFLGFSLFDFLLMTAVAGLCIQGGRLSGEPPGNPSGGDRELPRGEPAGEREPLRPSSRRPHREQHPGRCAGRGILAFGCAAVLVGVVCESSQLFRVSRSFQAIDLAANTLPAWVFLYALVRIRYNNGTKQQDDSPRGEKTE